MKTGARYNSKPAATTLATGVRNTAAAKEADDISTHSSKGFKKPASVALQAAGRDVQGMEGNRAGNKQTKRQAQAAAESAADVTASDAAPGPSRKKQRLQFDEPQSFPAARADVAVEPVQDTNEADDPHKQHKASRKKASKAKHGGEQQKAHERSFLADVLDPEEDPVPLSNQPRKPAAKSEPNVEVRKRMVDSGLLKVIDTLPSKAAKGKAAKQTQGASVAPSGVAAVQLLQTGTGLDTLQVGLGASSSWD